VDFPGGLGRRVTTLDSFLGISGNALLPKTNTSSVNVVLCQGTAGVPGKALADAFDIYLGTIGTIKTDFGLMLGHSGMGWAVVTNGFGIDNSSKGNFSGQAQMTLELPGFNRQINKQADISGKYENANHTIKEGYMILQVNDSYYASTKISNLIGAQPVKRCNTIAQNVKSGFIQTGSSITGAAWSNVRVYGDGTRVNGVAIGKKGTYLIDDAAVATKMHEPLIPCIVDVVPTIAGNVKGAPYVGWTHDDNYFTNETNISLSTVPLPSASCPNPAP
jgi:hypothetical protein